MVDIEEQATDLAQALIDSYGVAPEHKGPLIHMLKIELVYAGDARIEDMEADEDKPEPDLISVLIRKACKGSGVTVAEVMGRGRQSRITKIRFQIWHEMRERGWSTTEIGTRFGRDHTTVLSGLKRVTNGHG